jgi:hypothetical protein
MQALTRVVVDAELVVPVLRHDWVMVEPQEARVRPLRRHDGVTVEPG